MGRAGEFKPGERVRVAAPNRANDGRAGTVVDPDESWPFGPCVLLDGDDEPGAYDDDDIERLATEPSRGLDPRGLASPDGERLARAVAGLILDDRARLNARWQARLDAAAASARDLDRASLIAVLSCAEDYISGAPLNRALVLHALRSALVQLGERPGSAAVLPGEQGKVRR